MDWLCQTGSALTEKGGEVGMTDKEKVLHGLDSCGFHDGIPNICDVTECPYRDSKKTYCVHELAHDAGMLISELLKAQKAKEQCLKTKCIICPHCDNCDVDENGLLKAQEAQGWVSVKDRLPEVDNPVIVYACGKNDPIYKIVIASITNKNAFNTRLETEPYWREPWQFFDTMYEITHWMPLPEPPKEDDEE